MVFRRFTVLRSVHVNPWRRLVPVLVVIFAALVFNHVAGGTLWRWYSFAGLVICALVIWATHLYDWQISWITAGLAPIVLAMHFFGGGLGALEGIPGPNGLYAMYWWWDDAVHVLMSVMVAASAALTIATKGWRGSTTNGILLALGVAGTAGVLIELYEYSHVIAIATEDQGFYHNSMQDLFNNTWGSVVGAVVGWPWRRSHAMTADTHASDA